MVLQMVFSNHHCHLQCRHQKDKEITAKIQNILKICRKTSENRIQRVEQREETRQSPLRKENHASFENILENRWIRWQVFATYNRNHNQTTPSAPQTPRIQVNQEEANMIMFSPVVEQQVPLVQGATGFQEQPKRQRSPRKKKNSEWTLNKRQFNHNKTQEISHILPGEHLNVFNGEESVSYLQLPVKKKEENCFCIRCGEMGHVKHYCQAATWCKFCTSDTHATKACRRYEKFVKDNPIASSRRNTPVQVQGQRAPVNPQAPTQRPLFPNLPMQRFDPTVIPRMATNTLVLQGNECNFKEHSVSKQFPYQRSCQDVRMDPRYQKPPQYAEINYHQRSPQTPIEVNEIGPTIQQGVIQHPVQRHSQAAGERLRGPTVPVNVQQMTSAPNLQINDSGGAHERDRRQESDPEENGYVINCNHESRPFTVNDVGRPVFVNHYYVGEAFIPATCKKLIKLDECEVSTENSHSNRTKRRGNRCNDMKMQPFTTIYEKIPKIC